MNPQQQHPHYDTQLTRPTFVHPAMTDGTWTLATPAAGARRGESDEPQPLHKMHRLLRGRYKLAIALSITLATGLAAAGYLLPKPQYRSIGQIQIKPNIPKLEDATLVMPLYQQYVGSQVALLQHPRVIALAMGSELWHTYSKGTGPDAMKEFVDKLAIEYSPNSTLIQVTFTDQNPKRAKAAVDSMLDAYQRMDGADRDPQKLEKRDEIAADLLVASQREKNDLQKVITAIEEKYGTPDLSENITAFIRENFELQRQLTQAWLQRDDLLATAGRPAAAGSPEQYIKNLGEEIASGRASAATQPATANAPVLAADSASSTEASMAAPSALPLTATQLARMDPRIHEFTMRHQQATEERDRIQARLGPNHPMSKEAETRVARAKEQLDELIAEVQKDATATRISGTSDTVAGTVRTPEQLDRHIERLAKFIIRNEAKFASIKDDNIKLIAARKRLEGVEESEANAKRMKADLEAQRKLQQDVSLFKGDEPMIPAVDRRRQAAILGFLGGGAIPFVFFMLVGLSDKRYRYSDETKSEMGNVPLLGILPNLPDLLTDPQQAAIAAHCVHQIRTLLQVGVRTHDRHVYAITSAAPGDGKTSLTLALGLSFAASGSRTLLIDCDLVGGSLTRRLGVHTSDGMLEAMASRSPMDFVRDTDVNDLSILPVGSATMLSAGSFSPAGLRRLIAEARKSFDIVLIDTGPILGSIEAPPVAATADATILCVSRGQSRPAVDRSMHHLLAIGAKMAGIVFNRAEARDFEKSVSRFSQRSIRSSDHRTNGSLRLPAGKTDPDAKAAAAAGVDPVTRAVASDFKGENGNDPR